VGGAVVVVAVVDGGVVVAVVVVGGGVVVEVVGDGVVVVLGVPLLPWSPMSSIMP
jgi:hypothetical protein